MRYNFDEYHDRKNNQAVKLDYLPLVYGTNDVLPMWVADMDFKAADPIIDALERRVKQGIFGYTSLVPSYFDSYVKWVEKRHDWQVDPNTIIYSPGVVHALIMCVKSLTQPGDGIIIQSPVYGPFKSSIENHGRNTISNSLKWENDRYEMDFNDLEEKMKSGAKAMMLCNPHNPVGRVWPKSDLERLAKLIVKYKIPLISDEIHSDLIMQGHKHIPIASLNDDIAKYTVTCMAPSKTFNLAGLQSSVVVTANETYRNAISKSFEAMDLILNNCFGQVAFEAAYREGEPWLTEVLDYIEGNMDWVVDYVSKALPNVKVYKPEATYLMWFDFSALGMDQETLKDFMVKEAKVGLVDGVFFGQEGHGFMRYNVATTRERVKQGILQIESAIKNK